MSLEHKANKCLSDGNNHGGGSLVHRELTIDGSKIIICGHDEQYTNSLDENSDRVFRSLAHALITPNSAAIDVGANIGFTSLLMSNFSQAREIHAFEPGPTNYSLLLRNLQVNRVKNVCPVRSAIGAIDQPTVAFYESSAWGSVRLNSLPQAGDPPLLRLDTYVSEQKVNAPIKFVKIDVEGYEWEVLKGMKGIINRDHPIIYMEFNVWCLITYGNVNIYDFLGFLSTQFCYCYRASKDGSLHIEEINLRSLRGQRELVMHNIFRSACVDDLILSNERLLRLTDFKISPLLAVG